MPAVVFVAPFYLEATLRFVRAVAELPGVRLGLLSQEPEEKLPGAQRRALAGHCRVADALDAEGIAAGVRGLAGRIGRPVRLLGVLEQLQVPLAEARERLGIPGLAPDAARNFRDKDRMKSVLARAGLPCARHRLVRSASEALGFAADAGFPLVAKPPAGAGAKSTFRLDGRRQLEEALRAFRPAPERPLLLEEFLAGEEHSFDSALVGGRIAWHSVSDYLPSPLDVLRHPWIQWAVLLPREVEHPRYDAIRAIAGPALRALGLETGFSHLEWFRLADGRVAISEVGARPPGARFMSLMSWAADADLYRAWARLAVYSELDPPAPLDPIGRPYAAGAAYFRGQGEGRVVALHGLDAAQRELGSLVVEARLPAPGQGPSGSYEGEGYAILRHSETAVVSDALARLVSLVRVELG